jgi:hypothetical protein
MWRIYEFMSVHITRISVKITCINVKITRMIVEITRRVPKLHAWRGNHTRACSIAASQNQIWIFWWSYVNFSWFVLKPHALCWNKTHACLNQTRACRNHTHTCQNPTLRIEFTIVRVESTDKSAAITFVRVKITLCIWKSHSACINHTRACCIHTFCSKITLKIEHHTCVCRISHLCVLKSQFEN